MQVTDCLYEEESLGLSASCIGHHDWTSGVTGQRLRCVETGRESGMTISVDVRVIWLLSRKSLSLETLVHYLPWQPLSFPCLRSLVDLRVF